MHTKYTVFLQYTEFSSNGSSSSREAKKGALTPKSLNYMHLSGTLIIAKTRQELHFILKKTINESMKLTLSW